MTINILSESEKCLLQVIVKLKKMLTADSNSIKTLYVKKKIMIPSGNKLDIDSLITELKTEQKNIYT